MSKSHKIFRDISSIVSFNGHLGAPRPEGVIPDLVIFYYTGLSNNPDRLNEAIKILHQKGLGSHFTIDFHGRCWNERSLDSQTFMPSGVWYKNVKDKSEPQPHDINRYGIYILLEGGPGLDFTESQINKLIALCVCLKNSYKEQHDIDLSFIGYGDVNFTMGIPGPPGHKFPWDRLAKAGIGEYYEVDPKLKLGNEPIIKLGDKNPIIYEITKALREVGYNISPSYDVNIDVIKVLEAFDTHYNKAATRILSKEKGFSQTDIYILEQLVKHNCHGSVPLENLSLSGDISNTDINSDNTA